MKTHFLSASALTALLLAACNSSKLPDRVDMPYCDGNLSCLVEVTGVTRTDSNTVMTFLASNTPGWFEVTIPQEAYLTTGNDHLPIIGAEGIEPGTSLRLKEGVPAEFKLIFPPLPEGATSVDFVDPRQSQLRICIWGIDLTGRRPVDGIPSEIPEKLRTTDLSGTLPKASTDTGTATVNIRLAAFRPWISPNGTVVINHPNGRQQQLPFTADNDGNATVKVRLAGTTDVTVFAGNNVWSASYVDPGEDVDFYVMPTNCSDSQRGRLNTYCDGKFGMTPLLDHLSSRKFRQTRCDLEGELLYQCTDRDTYFANALEADRRLRDSINATDAEPMLREWMMSLADIALLKHIANPSQYIIGEWNDVNDSSPRIEFTPEQIAQVTGMVDFNSPAMRIIGPGRYNNRTAWPEGSVPHKAATMRRISRRSIETGKLTEAEVDTLRSLGNPYYLKAAQMLLEAEKDTASGKFVG